MEKKYTGTGWLNFYVRWRFPLGFVFGALSIISAFGNASLDGYTGSTPFIVGMAIDIALYIFRIVVYENMKRMTEKGYQQNVVLLALETLCLAIPRTLTSGINDLALQYIIGLGIVGLIWFLPNYIYFKHRKYMFTGLHNINDVIYNDKLARGSSVNSPSLTEPPSDKKFVCKACGHYSSGWYQECPNCGQKGQMVKATVKNSPVDKKYVCEACGQYNSGWYQTCPSCGKIGRMVKVSELNQPSALKLEDSIHSDIDKQESAELTVCPSCGLDVQPDTKFCRHCGASLLKPPVQETKPQKSDTCPVCGNELHDGMKFCNQCGTRLIEEDVVKPVEEKSLVDVPQVVIEDEVKEIVLPQSLDLSTLPPALRRAYIFIEDEDWDRANTYLERVLDEEPENAYAYLGKALIDIKVDSPEHITPEEFTQLSMNRNFRRAKKYATGELQNILEHWQ